MEKILMIVIGLFLMSTSLVAVAEKVDMSEDQANTSFEQAEEAKEVVHDHRKQKGLSSAPTKKVMPRGEDADVEKKAEGHDHRKEHK
tara:strand:- start:1189 stop:1449 length:261 start_codon:yes stop_codon:yes gene_type:complete